MFKSTRLYSQLLNRKQFQLRSMRQWDNAVICQYVDAQPAYLPAGVSASMVIIRLQTINSVHKTEFIQKAWYFLKSTTLFYATAIRLLQNNFLDVYNLPLRVDDLHKIHPVAAPGGQA